jgi:hypothetical protein
MWSLPPVIQQASRLEGFRHNKSWRRLQLSDYVRAWKTARQRRAVFHA